MTQLVQQAKKQCLGTKIVCQVIHKEDCRPQCHKDLERYPIGRRQDCPITRPQYYRVLVLTVLQLSSLAILTIGNLLRACLLTSSRDSAPRVTQFAQGGANSAGIFRTEPTFLKQLTLSLHFDQIPHLVSDCFSTRGPLAHKVRYWRCLIRL